MATTGASSDIAKATGYVDQAERLIQTSCTKNESKIEQAADLFKKAGNLYKLGKQYSEAIASFQRAGELFLTLDDEIEAASNFENACRCCELAGRIGDAISYLEQAAQRKIDENRIVGAAQHYKKIAELRSKNGEFIIAARYYEKAAELVDIEGQPSSATQLLASAAQCYAHDADHYEKAAEMYERVATEVAQSESTMRRYFVPDHLFHAGICFLAFDVVTARKALERFSGNRSDFSGTKQYRNLEAFIKAAEDNDETAFTNAVLQYESNSGCLLDSWKTRILLNVKRQIKGESLGAGLA